MEASETQEPNRAHLGMWDTVSIIVGIVIGAGIYETPPFIFQSFSSAGLGLLAWVLGGVLAVVGALCYSELATTYPRSGGDYVYLTRAYGPFFGFLFGWAQLAVILTGSIGMMAYIFADYADQIWPLGLSGKLWAASLAIICFTVLNIAGVVLGKSVQNLLTAVKILGLAGILIAGLLTNTDGATLDIAAQESTTFAGFASAMVLILLTYGGWNDAAFVAAEVRNKQRDIPRALLVGVGVITAIYLAVNFAYLRVLGLEGVQQSGAVAADMMRASVGEWGSRFISMLVIISALGAINGLIFAGARVYASLGADHGVFAWLSGWSSRRGTPVPALTAQGLIALAMVLAVGTEAGQSALTTAFQSLGFQELKWEGRSGFSTLVQCTAPIFWIFFLLTALSVFVLRARDPNTPRPFSVPLYPVVPAIFALTCAYMVYSGIVYAGLLGLVGAVLLVLGIPLYLISQPRTSSPSRSL